MVRGKGLDRFPWDCDRMTWCPRAVSFRPRVSGILFLWIKADAGIGHNFCRSAGNNISFHLPARILFTYSHSFYSFCYIAKHKRGKKLPQPTRNFDETCIMKERGLLKSRLVHHVFFLQAEGSYILFKERC